MKLFHTATELTTWVKAKKKKGLSIGFCPTMGALHQGHLSLIQQSQKENDLSICSIFVNPTQFDNPTDLEKYPNTLDQDITLLESINCDTLYLPTVLDLYPGGTHSSTFDFNGLDQVMEGAFRDNHFNGVGTVVNRLFRISQPNKAYFGEKDFQQLQIIRKLVDLESLPIEIIGVAIHREADGLAMSSRNLRLSKAQRNAAPFIYKSLKKAKEMAQELDFETIKKSIKKDFSNSELKLEYFTICEEHRLIESKQREEGKKYRAFIAAYAGKIRLIDNLQIH